MVNLGVWLAGYALVDWWLVPWVAANVAFDPASALVGLASLPWWAQAVVGLFAIDLAEWLLHWIQHRVRPAVADPRGAPLDPHVDVTTALRHHPLELLVALAWQAACCGSSACRCGC
jgi:sterol desaturase/sphingolipid hydroxylase (fatty acid hydroxylase superfamily)